MNLIKIKWVLYVMSTTCLFLPTLSISQILVTENEFETHAGDPSAVLELASSKGGLLLPRLTLSQRNAISNPKEGLVIFNLDERCLNVSRGTEWQTYCNIRYSDTCGCLEYLHNYGTANEAWIQVSSQSVDADWLDPLTRLPPTDVRDDVYTLGKTFVGGDASPAGFLGQLNVIASSDDVSNGAYIDLQGSSPNTDLLSSLRLHQNTNTGDYKVGLHSTVNGNNDAGVFGIFNLIAHDGNKNKFSIYNPYASDGNGDQTGVYTTFSGNGTGVQRGVYNFFSSLNTGEHTGMLNIFYGDASPAKHGIFNKFRTTANSPGYGAYNLFEDGNTGNAYGTFNDFQSAISGTQYGAYNKFSENSAGVTFGGYNKFSSSNAINSYGVWNQFDETASGLKAGVYNNFRSSTETGSVYGLYNVISNDSPFSKYGLYNTISNIGAGSAYGTRTNIVALSTNTNNQYGIYNTVSGGSGTNYGGYFSALGAGNYGLYANNTSIDGKAGAFNGDVEVGNGFLTVGEDAPGTNNLENSMVRYGVWERDFGAAFPDNNGVNWIFTDNFHGHRYINLGNVNLPDHVPGTVVATQVVFESEFYAFDNDEECGLWITFNETDYTGATGWMGDKDIGDEYYKNYKFVSKPINVLVSDGQNIRCKIKDEDAALSLDDKIWFNSLRLKIYYQYTTSLQEGDIAASGLIYSNTNSQVGDLAEYFEVNNEHGIENGLIVTFKPGSNNEYKIAETPYSEHIVGVISENPSVVLNNPTVGPPVALAGRVKVKLAITPGMLIQSGDYLTTSSETGKAMKAKRPGRVIGYAVTNQKPGEDHVEILVQPGFYWPKDFQGVLDGM